MIDMNNNYLIHYGVLGMKWGVRKDPQKAFSKAQKKYEKIRSKSSSLKAKASKKRDRLYKIPRDPETISRSLHKIGMIEAKASKYAKQGERWLNSMNKTFANTPYKDAFTYIKDPSKLEAAVEQGQIEDLELFDFMKQLGIK